MPTLDTENSNSAHLIAGQQRQSTSRELEGSNCGLLIKEHDLAAVASLDRPESDLAVGAAASC